MVYELAPNRREAEELAASGFGYDSRAAAEHALATAEGTDPYYRNLLKVYAVASPQAKAERVK